MTGSWLQELRSFAQSDYQTGVVTTDGERCTGCRLCVSVCPASALELGPDEKSRMKTGADCISCGNCTAVCHTQAITVERFYGVPSGVYAVSGRRQETGIAAFPRFFGSEGEGGET